VLSAQAQSLDQALGRAMADGVPYVILDGKVFETDRLAETVTSKKGEDIAVCRGAGVVPVSAKSGPRLTGSGPWWLWSFQIRPANLVNGLARVGAAC
jgi:hypothetical protein